MSGGMMYEQKDVVLIPFPYSDLSTAKQRPALVLSNKKINKTDDRICCLITSQLTPDGLEVTPACFESGTLPFQSWVKPHRLFTIHAKIIRKKLCTCTSSFHKKVLAELSTFLKEE